MMGTTPSRRRAGTGLLQADEAHVVTVAPGDGRISDDVVLARAYTFSPVVRLVAGAAYHLMAPVSVPPGGRLYLNNAVINRAMISLGDGAIIADDPPPDLAPLIGEILPCHVGAVAWTANPARGSSMITYGPSAYMGRLVSFLFTSAGGGLVRSISYATGTAGTGLDGCYLGIYEPAVPGGRLLAATPDQSAGFGAANGVTTAPLDPPVILAPDTRYRIVMLMATATTAPSMWAIGSINSSAYTNMGLTGQGNYMTSYSGTGFTELPAQLPGMGIAAGYPAFVLT